MCNGREKNKYKKCYLYVIKILFACMLVIILRENSALANNIYDMQDINVEVKKPISNFMIEYIDENGEYKNVYANSNFYDSDRYIFDQEATHITLKEGTKIKLIDLSMPGSGTEISKWDLQLYMPSKEYLYYESERKNVEKEISLEEGKYEIYLSVMDNYQNVKGYDNWSINGNHRWLSESKTIKGDYYYWYFSQLNITVVSNDVPSEDESLNVDDVKEKDDLEIDTELEINHIPETWISHNEILYPKEITDKNIKTNVISWFYYDEDDDVFLKSGYKLYRVENSKDENRKELIQEDDNILKRKDCEITLEGMQDEEFILEVYVVDEFENIGVARKNLKINTFIPNVKIQNYDRVYLNDDLEIDLTLKDDEINNNLIINYDYYEVLDENNNVVITQKGKIPKELFIDKNLFKEERNYKIIQNISNSIGINKRLESNFFIVPILNPEINLKNMTGFYSDEIDTNIKLMQPQSLLKGALEDYEYEFKDEDGYFEIYKDNSLIFSNVGILRKIFLDERMNIKSCDKNQVFKVIQYVKNDRDKLGMKEANLLVKSQPEDYISLEICERDEDITTIKNEIYPNESLLFKSMFFVSQKTNNLCSKIYDSDGNLVYKNNKLFDGLTKINLKEGEYKACVQISYIDENGEEKILCDEEYFKVKKVEKPTINISNVKENYTRLESLTLNVEIIDVNKSEEHPNGFSYDYEYEIFKNENDKMNKITNKSELFKEIYLNEFENNKKYCLTQKAINKSYNEIVGEESVEFYVKNLLPILTIEKNEKYFTGEVINILIQAEDFDGYIKELKLNNQEDLMHDIDIEQFNIISEKEMKSAKMNITLKLKRSKQITFEVIALDDSGDKVIENYKFEILSSDFYSNIEVLTKEKERMKINRYIRIKYGNSKGKNDSLKILANYYLEDTNIIYNKIVHLNEIGDIYEDEKIKIIVEEIVDNNQKIAGLYFKESGAYQIETFAIYEDKKSEVRKIDIVIKTDERPAIKLIVNYDKYRDNITLKSKAILNALVITEEEVGEIFLFVDDVVRKIEKFEELNRDSNIEKEIEMVNEFEFFENELGKKNLKLKVYEEHNFLPPSNHLFFEELKSKFKNNISNECVVEIENMAPTITYSLNNSKLKLRVIE